MAHEIESMTYAGEVPWHKLGTKIDDSLCYDWLAVSKAAGLDWQADLVDLMTTDTGAIVTHRAVRRNTDGKILGVVGPDFRPLQNAEAFAWFVPFLESRQAQLHTAGSLRGGSRVWVLAKLNRDPMVIATGDEVEKYLLLSHGHDGSLCVRVGFTPIRVVCANTLAQSHNADASKLIRLKHTAGLQTNLANVREIMDLANQQFEASAEQYRLLARKSINQADLRKYVKLAIGVDKIGQDATAEAALSTRTKNTIERIMSMAEYGRGNDMPSIKGTYWAAYNGVSEWLVYDRGHSDESRLNSLWYGDSSNLNRQALELALAMAT